MSMSPAPPDGQATSRASQRTVDEGHPSEDFGDRPAVAPSRLNGLRVLVVEDEYLVALLLDEDIRAAGCTVAGPYTTVAAARTAALSEPPDLAILDVNLNGEMIYPLAEELADRGVPLVFLTGYDVGHFPARFRQAPRLGKPHEPGALLREIGRALNAGERAADSHRAD